MNRTIWTGRISRGYLVLPLAESTMDLHPVVQALSRWASPRTEILQPFWSAIPMLDAHWRSSSVTQGLQQDAPRGCKDPGGSCSSKLPSVHWPLASWKLFCSWCRTSSSFHQLIPPATTQLDFEPLALLAWWFTHVKLHQSSCGCQHHSYGKPPPSLPGKGRRLQAQASLGIAWKTWCSNLKGDWGALR